MGAEISSGLPTGLLDVVAWLLTYALHSTVLIGGAWLVAVSLARVACRMRRLRDLLPSIRERLWKVALVGGIVTATLQTTFEIGPWQMRFADTSSAGQVSVAPRAATLAAIPADATFQDHASSAAERAAPTQQPALRTLELDAGHAPGLLEQEVASPAWSGASWVGVVLALWAIGVAFGLARWICQWNRLLRELDDRTPLRRGLLFDRLQRLRAMAGVKLPVTLSSAPSIAAPMTLGLRRAEICVPPRVESELRREEVDALLAHELAHAERRDPAWLVVSRAIEVVFFFQPLNRLCANWIADEAEYLADDWAVTQTGERVGMASCLTEIAGWMVREDESRLVAGMAARGTRLTLRVGRLLDEEHEPETSARGTWVSGALAPFGLSAALLVPGISTADDETSAKVALQERTSRLELELTTLDVSAPASAPEAPPPFVSSALPEMDLDEVLAVLQDEIECLREELSTRVGGESHAAALDQLEQRVTDLRARASALQERLGELTASGQGEAYASDSTANRIAFESTHKD